MDLVTLKCKDGKEVEASKSNLIKMSPVFESLLTKEWKESSDQRVSVGKELSAEADEGKTMDHMSKTSRIQQGAVDLAHFNDTSSLSLVACSISHLSYTSTLFSQALLRHRAPSPV